MKKILSLLLVTAMLLAVIPAAFAAENTQILAEETVPLKTASDDEYVTFSYDAAADGIVALTMKETNPGWCYQVTYPDGTEGLLKTGKAEVTVEFELLAGQSISFKLGCYDKAGWSQGDGTISYKVTFTSAEIEQKVEYQEYALASSLSVGANAVTLIENAYLTAYEFAPKETGTYTFTAPAGVKLCNYGTPSFPYNVTTANGETMTNTVSFTFTAVGQSILIGVDNAELNLTSTSIQVAKTADYQQTVITEKAYENKATLSKFAIPSGYTAGAYVDIYGETVHTAVLGDDGYYHLDSADGDILLVDMNYLMDLDGVLASDRPIMSVTVTDADGSQTRYDITEAVKEYIAVADKNEYYPLTEDLMFFYRVYGKAQGWYMEGASIFTETVTVEDEEGVSETVTEQLDFNAECAWMFACITMVADTTEEEPTDSTGAATESTGAATESTTDATTGVITPETVTPETGDALGSTIAVTVISALCIAVFPAVKKKFF